MTFLDAPPGYREISINPELMQKMEKFAEFISKNDKIVIAHHVDADGLCSLYLLIHWIAQIKGEEVGKYNQSIKCFAINNGDRRFERSQEDQLLELHDQGFTGIIFLDINPRDSHQLQELTNAGWNLTNLDHHKNDSRFSNILMINPTAVNLQTDPDNKTNLNQLSSSAIFWLYAKKLAKSPLIDQDNKLLEIARVGNLGDGYDYLKNLDSDPNPEKDEKLLRLANILNILGACEEYGVTPEKRDNYIDHLFSLLFNSLSVDDAISNFSQEQKFVDISTSLTNITAEIIDLMGVGTATPENASNHVKITTKTAIDGSKLIVCEIDHENHRYDLTANLVKIFYDLLNSSTKVENTTTIAFIQKSSESNHTITLCTNSQNNHCGEIMIQAGKQFNGGGGGHQLRAGATIASSSISAFKEFLEYEVFSTSS